MATRAALGAILLSTLAFGAACSGEAHHELDPYLCTQEDLGNGFQQLIDGDVSPRNLADLGPDPGERERQFLAAGMERGRFVVFKQALPKPPFDPPVNVLCQALEFNSADSAKAWVLGLAPEPDTIRTSAMGWLPAGTLTVTEGFPGTPTGPTSTAGISASRAFAVHGGSGHESTYVVYEFRAYGAFVTVSAAGGDLVETPEVALSMLNTFSQAVRARIAALQASP